MQSFSAEKAQKYFSGRGSARTLLEELTVLLSPYVGCGERRQAEGQGEEDREG